MNTKKTEFFKTFYTVMRLMLWISQLKTKSAHLFLYKDQGSTCSNIQGVSENCLTFD